MTTAMAGEGGQPTPDLDLVVRHRYGDEEAFTEVFERFQGMVFNLAYRMTGDEQEAQDLSQEVFVRVYRHLEKFRGKSTLKTWIYRIAVNQCNSKLSRRRLKTRSLDREEGRVSLQIADTERGPEERAMGVDARRQVQAALLEVAQPFRQAVVLRDIEGLSYEEIAEVEGVAIGTVRSRIARGRAQLRTALEEAKP